VHQSVQQVALGATARPTVFVLVGDHAPPFGDPELLAEFSSTQVPYVMLTPRQQKF
jgi:phosphoglycerol transferase MdoB-like AlkP superfamily enzyme